MDTNKLQEISKWIRYQILLSTTTAMSGHPTTSLSATDLMAVLFFNNHFRFLIQNPKHPNNDRLIFSKGHASPLFYALWAAAGAIEEKELLTLRKFNSRLEGHPTPKFPYAEAATGSLGQGLSIGLGMALNAKYLDKLPYNTYVLLGDGELVEGQVWEAAELAVHYKLNNLIAIIDINRLGQSGATLHQWDLKSYQAKFDSFGWKSIIIDGHNFEQIDKAYTNVQLSAEQPVVILAKTKKGKGVSFIENREGWHGKPLSQDELKTAILEIGPLKKISPSLLQPENLKPKKTKITHQNISLDRSKPLATRKAYGLALIHAVQNHPEIVALDGETRNSTYSETFMNAYPERFFEMYIAEQNMIGTAAGLAGRGKIPFVSTFAAFLTRSHDQIRMSQYSCSNIKICGSHAGVSIGEDGSSQMGLEDIAMFTSVLDSVVLYPADATATIKLVDLAAKYQGIVYIRTTRSDTIHLYTAKDSFKIGGSQTLKSSLKDSFSIITGGITLHEALKAYELLKQENIYLRIIDIYSIKPIDIDTLQKAHDETTAIITVEDHYPCGGLGTAVNQALSSLKNRKPIYQLSVTKIPKSGTPDELLRFEEIDKTAIVKKVRTILD